MSFINKPKVHHPDLPTNALGLTRRDYEGAMSTLCAGCGHDSVTAAIIEAIWGLSLRPEQLVKLSGIGCSSKTTAYFASGAHGFNGVHGRMPSVATGANAANKELVYIGVSGDGDSLSIGFGQFAHAIRRNVNMLYLCENNGVYGLTKGQFSATADAGSLSKRGAENRDAPIDLVAMALQLGATFVARSFSGDKQQLVPLLKAAILHQGAAFIDCISPCVAFNNHAGSTKSFDYVRAHNAALNRLDIMPPRTEITADYAPGETHGVKLHDGSTIHLRKVAAEHDVHDKVAAMNLLQQRQAKGEIVTGLLYMAAEPDDLHAHLNTLERPFNELGEAELCPGDAALQKFNAARR
jgi:2-oxoglutarate ferredoxin oxidoreductase subunit beta